MVNCIPRTQPLGSPGLSLPFVHMALHCLPGLVFCCSSPSQEACKQIPLVSYTPVCMPPGSALTSFHCPYLLTATPPGIHQGSKDLATGHSHVPPSRCCHVPTSPSGITCVPLLPHPPTQGLSLQHEPGLSPSQLGCLLLASVGLTISPCCPPLEGRIAPHGPPPSSYHCAQLWHAGLSPPGACDL